MSTGIAAVAEVASRLLPADAVISDEARLRTYECDGLAHYRVTPALVVLPPDAGSLAAIVRDVLRARRAVRGPRLGHRPLRWRAAPCRGRADRDVADARHPRRTP